MSTAQVMPSRRAPPIPTGNTNHARISSETEKIGARPFWIFLLGATPLWNYLPAEPDLSGFPSAAEPHLCGVSSAWSTYGTFNG